MQQVGPRQQISPSEEEIINNTIKANIFIQNINPPPTQNNTKEQLQQDPQILLPIFQDYYQQHQKRLIYLIFKNYLNCKMSFPILVEYSAKFPQMSSLLDSLPALYSRKLWNELTVGVLEFIYHPQIKGKVTFAFYHDFVKRFQRNIDQINLLKIIRESLASLTNSEILTFLKDFEAKQANTDETKTLILAYRGFYSIPDSLEAASEMIAKVKEYIDSHKDVDTYIYSSYYKLAFTFYAAKRRYKQFYTSALQYLAYTQAQEIEENEKLSLLFQMAIAVLLSEEIYNFSELLEQPLLVSLKNSSFAWMYELLEIFNRGDITQFGHATLDHEELKQNRSKLDQKIRLMALLELTFNLPKSNRVVSFETLQRACFIPLQHVQFMVMKAMALGLIKGSINQIRAQVTITWVAPKVLQTQRISTMLSKFQQWQNGVKGVQKLVKTIKA